MTNMATDFLVADTKAVRPKTNQTGRVVRFGGVQNHVLVLRWQVIHNAHDGR